MTSPAKPTATPSELSAAYRAAAEREAGRVRAGAAIVGYKVGFTNRQTWEQLGANAPMWGAMYDDTTIDAQGAPFRYSLAALQGPRIEPEIVVCLGKTPAAGASLDALIDCIDWLALGYEIVLTPPDGPPTVPQVISSGGMHGAMLVGTRRPVADLGGNLASRLADLTVELRCNGELKETGKSAIVLDNPLNAVLHLMGSLQQEGRPPLKAGDIITTGTMTSAYPMAPGQRWTASLQGLDLPDLDVLTE